ncbi:hypothetical protein ABE444_07715 [Brevundimonas pondensis]|uniref:hypothetical protein n=1 Tax=Brevundimonas pondensis TaxID=2774189 RepID=UPI00320A57CD
MPKHQRIPSKQRKWRRHPPQRQLAVAFARNARGFLAMAWIDEDRVGAQSAYHSAIAIELGLKAYLLHRGFSDDWTRVWLRHDVSKALRCVRMLGFQGVPNGIAELAAALSPLYGSGALRSGVKPDLPLPPDVADQAIRDLLSAVEAAIEIDSGTDR